MNLVKPFSSYLDKLFLPVGPQVSNERLYIWRIAGISSPPVIFFLVFFDDVSKHISSLLL